MSPDATVLEVLRRYPAHCRGEVVSLGNHGGFSGARLWRVAGYCLRAWPPDDSFSVRLDQIHRLMKQARDAGLTFVPHVAGTIDGKSFVYHNGHCWELAEWLPGSADYHANPSTTRLEAACVALARLHRIWEKGRPTTGVCPAVERRLDGLKTWHRLRNDRWHPLAIADKSDPLCPLIERAVAVLSRHLGALPGLLTAWTKPQWSVQSCLCDIWHDHLLFGGDRLTGLIDYGSVKVDHVAVDLARMLGSLIADDEEGWRLGLAAYRDVRRLSEDEALLARALDRTGTVLGVANWLRWLYADRREFADRAAVGARLGTLVSRIEKWGHS